jgi:hypothetical protein
MTCGPAWIFMVRYRRAVRTSLRTAKKGQAITARLIVRRVRDQNTKAAGTGELFPVWRYHPVFTGSPFTLLQAEARHPRPRHRRAAAGGLDRGPDGPPALRALRCQRRPRSCMRRSMGAPGDRSLPGCGTARADVGGTQPQTTA